MLLLLSLSLILELNCASNPLFLFSLFNFSPIIFNITFSSKSISSASWYYSHFIYCHYVFLRICLFSNIILFLWSAVVRLDSSRVHFLIWSVVFYLSSATSSYTNNKLSMIFSFFFHLRAFDVDLALALAAPDIVQL